MKKVFLAMIITLSVGLAMILVGSVLAGINWTPTGVEATFDGTALSLALSNVGYVVFMLSCIVLTGLGVPYAVKGDCKKEEKNEKNEK